MACTSQAEGCTLGKTQLNVAKALLGAFRKIQINWVTCLQNLCSKVGSFLFYKAIFKYEMIFTQKDTFPINSLVEKKQGISIVGQNI